jgi:hypothetical protein
MWQYADFVEINTFTMPVQSQLSGLGVACIEPRQKLTQDDVEGKPLIV